jgi:hypothetical protein
LKQVWNVQPLRAEKLQISNLQVRTALVFFRALENGLLYLLEFNCLQ